MFLGVHGSEALGSGHQISKCFMVGGGGIANFLHIRFDLWQYVGGGGGCGIGR